MKKFLLSCVALLGLGFAANADVLYDGTITKKTWEAAGVQTLDEVEWNLQATWGSGGSYFGNADATKGQQIGSGSAPASTLTLSTSAIDGTITSVTVNTSGASKVSATVAVSVNGVDYLCNGKTTAAISATANDYTFVADGAAQKGEIVISWANSSKKALYFKNIKVEGEVGVPEAPKVVFSHESDVYPSGTQISVSCEGADALMVYMNVAPADMNGNDMGDNQIDVEGDTFNFTLNNKESEEYDILGVYAVKYTEENEDGYETIAQWPTEEEIEAAIEAGEDQPVMLYMADAPVKKAPGEITYNPASGEIANGKVVTISAPGADCILINFSDDEGYCPFPENISDFTFVEGSGVVFESDTVTFTADIEEGAYAIDNVCAVCIPYGWSLLDALLDETCTVYGEAVEYTVVVPAPSNIFYAAGYTGVEGTKLVNIDGSETHSGATTEATSLVGTSHSGATVTVEFGFSGTTYPTVYGDHFRMYAGDYIKITPAEGCSIESVEVHSAASSEGSMTGNIVKSDDGEGNVTYQEVGTVEGTLQGASQTLTWTCPADEWGQIPVYLIPTGKNRISYFEVKTSGTPTGVAAVAVDANAPAEYYNLQGVRVAQPTQGLYIVRQGGRTSKVLVK